MRSSYSPEFKQSIVQKILMPGGPSISETSEKTGVHHTPIRNWLKTYGKVPAMKKQKNGHPRPKLEAIIKTAIMGENELGEYLRANRLHSSEIEQWKHDFYGTQRSVGRPKIDPERCDDADHSSEAGSGTIVQPSPRIG